MVRIARVFPCKTKFTPEDDDVFFRSPGLLEEGRYAEVHVSCVFSWHKEKAESLAKGWRRVCNDVKVGGPAYDDPGGEFVPGMYVRFGHVMTSRGCPKRCPFCLVPLREGKLRELEVKEGYDIVDNNLLACSRDHVEKVFDMLEGQKGITFTGGLDAEFLQDWHIDRLVSLGSRFRYGYFAYDLPRDRDSVEDALRKCHEAGLKQQQLGCYVLVGFEGDTVDKAYRRCEWVFTQGGIPFPMYYRSSDVAEKKKSKKWTEFANVWGYPMFSISRVAKEGLRYHGRCVRGKLADV